MTLEDLLEEIVGEIRDESHLETEPVIEEANGSYVFSAKVNIDQVRERLDVEIEADGFETVGGYVLARAGRVPSVGETFELDGFIPSKCSKPSAVGSIASASGKRRKRRLRAGSSDDRCHASRRVCLPHRPPQRGEIHAPQPRRRCKGRDSVLDKPQTTRTRIVGVKHSPTARPSSSTRLVSTDRSID